MIPKIFIVLLFVFCISLNANATTIFSDNFNDGTLADWDTNTGFWTAATLKAVGGGLDGSTLSHSVSTTAGNDYLFSFTNNPGSNGLSNSFGWFTDKNGVNNLTGYRVVIRTDSFQLQRGNGAGSFTVLANNPISILSGIDHNISILHTANGVITPYVDGNSQGSFTDTTYNSGSKIFLATTNGDFNSIWDDVNINTVGIKQVTVLRPINEKTLQTIYKPWTVALTGNSIQFVDNNANSKIFILPDINGITNFTVDDSNTTPDEFFARKYVVYLDNNSSITLQPYLIAAGDTDTIINARVIDLSSNITIPGLRFTLYAGINNSLTVVEDTITDITGIAQIVMLPQKNYTFGITTATQDLNYLIGDLTLVSDQIDFFINYTGTDSNFIPKNISYSIAPRTDSLTGVTSQIDFNVSADFNYNSVLVQALDNNRVVTSTTSTNNPFNSNITITLADFNSSQAIIRITVITSDTNTIITKTYNTISVGSGGILNLIGLRSSLNPNNFLFLMLFGLVGLVALMGNGVLGNNDNQVIVAGIGMGIMVFLFFREYFLYAIGMLFVGAIAWMWVRVNR